MNIKNVKKDQESKKTYGDLVISWIQLYNKI